MDQSDSTYAIDASSKKKKKNAESCYDSHSVSVASIIKWSLYEQLEVAHSEKRGMQSSMVKGW